MSTLKAARRHIRRSGAGGESWWRLVRIGLVLMLLFGAILGAILGAAQMHLLPTQSADDVGSILFDEH